MMRIDGTSPIPTGSSVHIIQRSFGIFVIVTARHIIKATSPVSWFLALATLFFCVSTPSIAETINQCKDDTGNVTFSDRPCPKNTHSLKINQQVTGHTPEGALLNKWVGYCVATFTRDFAIKDVFGDVELRIPVGSKYLMSHFDYASYWDSIMYPENGGVIAYRFKHLQEDLPFTTNCNAKSTRQVIAVFKDTVIFADEGLTKELCRLDAGSVLHDTSFSLDLQSQKGIGKVENGVLSDRCGGRDKFFVAINIRKVAGVTQLVSPIGQLLAPL